MWVGREGGDEAVGAGSVSGLDSERIHVSKVDEDLKNNGGKGGGGQGIILENEAL